MLGLDKSKNDTSTTLDLPRAAQNEKPPESRSANWMDLARFIGATLTILVAVFVYLFVEDPYGRWGFRSSSQIPNLAERELMVSRAMDPQFDSAIVGNSTSREVLDRLTGDHFVSLSMSGSQSPVALTAASFFLRHHLRAKVLIVALDDSWCTKGDDVDEIHPFPDWLWGNRLEYLAGLSTHLSWETIRAAHAKSGANRIDGYHPYDDAFREHGFNDIEVVKSRLDQAKRPVEARYSPPYHFDPPEKLRDLIANSPGNVTFILLWTPRYLSIIPMERSAATVADAACKQQVAKLAAPRVRIVDWSGPRPENLDPSNFYETNHYRDALALKIENEIADSLRGY
jgi:hypothetical protein